ncbi:MAG: hypothetical protein PHE49_03520 [bacterium]|nr:hypothetical protein [bacterium]
MKLLKWAFIFFVASSLSAYELKLGSAGLGLINDSKAEVTFKVNNSIDKPFSMRVMLKHEYVSSYKKLVVDLTDTVIAKFYPDKKEYSFSIGTGEYVLELCDAEGFEIRLEKDKVTVGNDMYIKDGKAVYTKPINMFIESNIILIKGKLVADNSIIQVARELCVNKHGKGSSTVETYKLKITNGQIDGILQEEGDYDISVLSVELPKLNPELVTAQVELTPNSFTAKKGPNNNLIIKVTPKIQKVAISSNISETYVIEKPNLTYYDLNKIIHNVSPTITPMPYPHPIEVGTGEYLLECIKDGKIYRKKMWVPPVSSMDMYRLEDWFDNSYEVGYSIAKTGCTGIEKEILYKNYNMQLIGSPNYDEDVPVFIGNKKYTIKFHATRDKNNVSSDFSIDNIKSNVLDLTEIAPPPLAASKKPTTLDDLYNKVKSQFNGRYTPGNEGTVILEKSLYSSPFRIDFKANLQFSKENGKWVGLAMEGNTISYKVYQLEVERVNLLDFFNKDN